MTIVRILISKSNNKIAELPKRSIVEIGKARDLRHEEVP